MVCSHSEEVGLWGDWDATTRPRGAPTFPAPPGLCPNPQERELHVLGSISGDCHSMESFCTQEAFPGPSLARERGPWSSAGSWVGGRVRGLGRCLGGGLPASLALRCPPGLPSPGQPFLLSWHL